MALLVECPQCKRRNSQKEKVCKGCGLALAKHSGRVWWIEYYVDGQRKRERIGTNKAAAPTAVVARRDGKVFVSAVSSGLKR